MGKTQQDSKPVTVGAAQSLIRRHHRSGESGQIRAGVAVVDAIDSGAVTFERTVPEGAPLGCLTRKGLADYLGTSTTTVSKYRTLGYLTRLGFGPEHTDWATLTGAHSAKWLTEAVESGKRETVERALADHRKGSQVGQGGQKGKATGGKGKAGATDGKAGGATADVPTDTATTARNAEAKVAAVCQWLTAGTGSRLTGMSAESLASILANLTAARDAVEAAQHSKASKASKAA